MTGAALSNIRATCRLSPAQKRDAEHDAFAIIAARRCYPNNPLMSLSPLVTALSPQISSVQSHAPAAGLALAVAVQVAAANGVAVVVAQDEQQAYRLEAELRFYLGAAASVVHLQGTETLPFDPFSPHQEILSERLACLHRLPAMTDGVLIVTADALLQRLPPLAWLQGRTFFLKPGQRENPTALKQRLISSGYQSVTQVQTQGEFAQRGSLMDLFPMGSALAYRIDWFDDDIESIRTFDPESQRSLEKVKEVRLLPAREFPTDKDGIETFRRNYREAFPGDLSRSRIYAEVSKGLMPSGIEAYLPLFFPERSTGMLADYLPLSARWLTVGDVLPLLAQDYQQITERHARYSGNLERPLLPPDAVFLTVPEAQFQLSLFPSHRIEPLAEAAAGESPIQAVLGGSETFKALLADTRSPTRNLFVAESAGRREAVVNWLKPLGLIPRQYESFAAFLADSARVGVALGPLQESLSLPPAGLRLIAEGQLFGLTAPQQQVARRRTKARDPETILRDLSSLTIGSPVVHVQHGVGRYLGLQTLDAGGVANEYLVLGYAMRGADDSKAYDKLYVPVASLSLIHRYTGSEEAGAPLHTLGNDRWEKAQAKARDRAHDVAAELLKIQARRASKPGLQLSLEDEDYRQFVAAFPFTTTPDQQTAIDAVLTDLQTDKAMDRVVCGDVGFGKTEVALRAAFAVARAGRQVCILAPTTLLAAQHEKNFRDRMADWPIRIAGLSRLKTTKEQSETLRQLEAGSVDIVIGTHRLLQPDIQFNDLGLVIVDEEHRFGVRHKERLKNLRAEVDLLTLTATPIPRTLNMSLAGLRDLSIIATPPPSRQAIKTVVAEWDNGLIYEACLRELKRGGQIYWLHNEVRDIEAFSAKVQQLGPGAKVRFAHGALREGELEAAEKIVRGFGRGVHFGSRWGAG